MIFTKEKKIHEHQWRIKEICKGQWGMKAICKEQGRNKEWKTKNK